MRLDFHLHTDWSDGTLSVRELAASLKNANLEVAAITDHDTMRSHVEPSWQAAIALKILAGVEINTNEAMETLHILGYGPSLTASPDFQQKLLGFRQARRRRAQAMVDKLTALGIGISMSDVEAHARESIGRPHVADALGALGVVQSRSEAFHRFLLKGKPAYTAPLGPDPELAIRSIVEAGGVAVLAHPGIARIDEKKLSSLVALGVLGIESYHPMHNNQQIRDYLSWARKFGLFITCGSDYHGPATGREDLTSYDFEERDFRKFLEAAS